MSNTTSTNHDYFFRIPIQSRQVDKKTTQRLLSFVIRFLCYFVVQGKRKVVLIMCKTLVIRTNLKSEATRLTLDTLTISEL